MEKVFTFENVKVARVPSLSIGLSLRRAYLNTSELPSSLLRLTTIAPPNPKIPALLFWSGGKDSALAAYKILSQGSYSIQSLITTLSPDNQVASHSIPLSLLKRQAFSLGIPFHPIPLPHPCPNHQYETRIAHTLQTYQRKGIYDCIFGDIFLEEIRAYRETHLAQIGMRAHFPLWNLNTHQLLQEFLHLGFRAIITAINPHKLPLSFLGRKLDAEFLADLPPTVDPSGENGEYHTFVYDGPMFKYSIPFQEEGIQVQENLYTLKIVPA